MLGLWFIIDELFHFLFGEQIIASINGFIAYSDFGNITNWLASAFHKHIIRIQQIAVDILNNLSTVASI